MALQTSLTSGRPPLISLDDFDTVPPGNFDDEQIMTENPVSQQPEAFTQVSIARVFRETFPQRLAVVKFLNDLASPVAYDKTLKLDATLRTAYKSLARTFSAYGRSTTTPAPLPSEIRMADFIMHRYLLSLHARYFGAAFSETAYAFSRKVVVESSLKIWRAAHPLTSNNNSAAPEANVLQRLATCSSGFYPAGAIHAAFLMGVDLRMTLKEDESLSPAPLRPNLLAVAQEAKQCCLHVVEAGETSVKGHLLMSVIATQIEGLVQRLGEERISGALIKAVEDVEAECMPMLTAMASEFHGPTNDAGDAPQSMDLANNDEILGDFGGMSSDALFDFPNTEPMGWMFNDDRSMGVPALW